MNERELFDVALTLDDPTERAAFLAQECGRDTRLQRHLGRLLDAYPRLNGFLESPVGTIPESAGLTAKLGDVIGTYKLLQQVGEGGFGVVYMAEQQRPVRRKVALKIIKAGMDSREVIARFEAERQALAVMDHPNIARVLDAGTTDSGRPFFVMDLVRGSPITEYCDQNKLTLAARLKLFVPVCRAIQHAHQKGIIHRDIKPSNVMITLSDGGPTPKVIDFGVAKAIDHRLTDRTMFTKFGQIIGTLEYMSPEQAEMGGMDIDTRSDVYSLGVVLYELLTGSTPLIRERLRGVAFDEVLRMIREVEPATPSHRISQSGEALVGLATQRFTEPRKLGAFVRGELDWVVMKALEKSRSRRYSTASELADDIEHFLQGEPVSACPPSWSYRTSKLARKHLGLIAGFGLLLTVLLVAAPLSVWQAHRATLAQVAFRTERDQARRARDEANHLRDAEAKAKLALAKSYEQLSSEQARTKDAHHRAIHSEARLASEKGHALVEQGRNREGLLWLIRALNNSPDKEPALRRAILCNIAAVWDDIPKPVATLPNLDGNGKGIAVGQVSETAEGRIFVDPLGTRLVRLSQSGQSAQLIDAASNAILGQVDVSIPRRLSAPSGGFGPFSPDGTVATLLQLPGASSGEASDSSTRTILLHRWLISSGAALGEPKPLKLRGDWSRGVAIIVGPRAEDVIVSLCDSRTGQASFQQYDIATGRAIDAAWADGATPSGGAITPNGLVLAATTSQPKPWPTLLELWSLRPQRRRIGEITPTGNIERLRFELDGRHLLTQGQGSIVRWTVPETRLHHQLLPHGSAIQAIARNRDKDVLVTVSGRHAIRWNLATGEAISPTVELPIPFDQTHALVALSSDGNMLAVADGATILRWDMRTGWPAGPPIHAPSAVMRIALDATGSRLLCACALDETKGEVHILDAVSGAAIRRPVPLLSVFDSRPRRFGIAQGAVALAPDGESLLATDKVVRLRTWDTQSPSPSSEFIEVRSGSLTDAQFTPDGRFVVTCANHQTIEVWDHSTCQRVGQPIRFHKPLRAHALSPDGQVLATAVDGQIRFWFLETGQPLGQAIQQSQVTALCFSGDGESLYAGDEQGLVRTWNAFHYLPPERLDALMVEAITGLRLSDDGLIEPLESDEWLEQFARYAELSREEPAATNQAVSHVMQLLVDVQSPDDWRWMRTALDSLSEQSEGGIARLFRARMHWDAQREDLAQEDVQKAIELGPRVAIVEWLKQLACQDSHRRQYGCARWFLDQAVNAGLADADVCLSQAELCVADGRGESASHWLQQAIDRQPNSMAVVRRVGEIDFRLGNWEAAAARLARALELGGGNGEVWRLRAACCAELGRWDQAADDLGKAVQRYPRDSTLREQLAVALVSSGNTSGYHELCADTVANFDFADYERRPWIAPALLTLAPDGLSDYSRIIQPAQNFADKYPTDCVSYHVLGPFCYRAKQYDRAALATPPPKSMQAVWADEVIFLAMAQAKMGYLDAARRKLAEVDAIAWRRADVWDRQRIHLLLAEAEELMSPAISE